MGTAYLRISALRPPEPQDDGTVLRWQIDYMEPNTYPDGTTNAIVGQGHPEDNDERHRVGGCLFETWAEAVDSLQDELDWARWMMVDDTGWLIPRLAWLYGCTEERVRAALEVDARGTL